MSQELNTERTGTAFGIENFYNPEALYSRLTTGHKSHTYELQNNWSKITEPGYDPILDIKATVTSDIKAKFIDGVSRSDKVFYYHLDLLVKDKWFKFFSLYSPEIPEGLIAELDKNGAGMVRSRLITNLSQWDYDSSANPRGLMLWHMFRKVGFYRSSKNEPGDFAIDVTLTPPEDPNITIRTVVPWPYADLNNVNEFVKSHNTFLKNSEKVIGAMFNFEGKELPPVKLEFKPEQEKSKEFFAQCSYCQSNYFTAQSLSCPHCGASSPIFMTKEE
jgi:hypothetical protein